jgi:hypothetical protein
VPDGCLLQPVAICHQAWQLFHALCCPCCDSVLYWYCTALQVYCATPARTLGSKASPSLGSRSSASQPHTWRRMTQGVMHVLILIHLSLIYNYRQTNRHLNLPIWRRMMQGVTTFDPCNNTLCDRIQGAVGVHSMHGQIEQQQRPSSQLSTERSANQGDPEGTPSRSSSGANYNLGPDICTQYWCGTTLIWATPACLLAPQGASKTSSLK